MEHDPEDIWLLVRGTCDVVMAEECGEGGEVIAVGITNQRETAVLWDRNTGGRYTTPLFGRTGGRHPVASP